MRVAIIHNKPVAGRPDSEDVTDQVRFVADSVLKLGWDYKQFPLEGQTSFSRSSISNGQNFSTSLSETIFYMMWRLKKYSPHVIFNLVEGINDNPFYQQFFVLLFEHLKYPFTGSGYSSILTTSDKSISKMLMRGFNILSPDFNEYRGKNKEISIPPPWIVKPALEDASVGIDESSVFYEKSTLAYALPVIYEKHGRQTLIIEHYIHGREFNVSLLEKDTGVVEVLPISEIVFHDWQVKKPMIVGYRAKWDKKSFEYNNTLRSFQPSDVRLDEIKSTALKCWKVFKLKGYARVDIRISEDGEVHVLEINANPCISADSGYVAALMEAGYSNTDFIKMLIDGAIKRHV